MNIQHTSLTKCTVEFLHWVTQIILKLNFFTITKRVSDWHHFCKWKFLLSILQVAVSVGTIATDTFYSNYAGANICCNYAVFEVLLQLCFCTISSGESICHKYVGDNFYWNYALGSLCYNHAGSIFYGALCKWLFLL